MMFQTLRDIPGKVALILFAGAACLWMALGAQTLIRAVAGWLGVSAAGFPDFPLAFLSIDQLLAMGAIWAVVALGLGGWPFALRVGEVIGEGIVFVIGVTVGAQIWLGVEAVIGGADPLRQAAARGLYLWNFIALSIALIWLPRALAAERFPFWLRAVVAAALVAATAYYYF